MNLACPAPFGCVGFVLLEQPGAFLTQSHEALQLGGVDVLADVQRRLKRVLDVQRSHFGFVLLLALNRVRGEDAVNSEVKCQS